VIADNARSLADLAARVDALGRKVFLGTLPAWVERLDAAGHEARLAVAASLTDPTLPLLVDDFGAELVLAEISRARERLRRVRGGQR
jgi:hypothetical protein